MNRFLFVAALMAISVGTYAQFPETENKPVATIAGLHSGDLITPQNIAAQAGVGVYVYTGVTPSADPKKAAGKIMYRITRFRASVLRDGMTLFTAENEGNVFNEKTKAALTGLKAGDMVVISEISAIRKGSSSSPAAGEEHLGPVLYEIK